jgi:hypothetical protein
MMFNFKNNIKNELFIKNWIGESVIRFLIGHQLPSDFPTAAPASPNAYPVIALTLKSTLPLQRPTSKLT